MGSQRKVFLKHDDIFYLADELDEKIRHVLTEEGADLSSGSSSVYAVPRGGIPVCYVMSERYDHLYLLVETPEEADVIIDDIVDSGATRDRYWALYPDKPFLALVNPGDYEGWVVFPWEVTADGGIEDNIRRLLQFVGEDPNRGGLLETPARVAKAWRHWCGGYDQDPASILKVFEDGAEQYDEMVVVKDIPVYSHCEHHLAPIFGTVTIAYIPDGKIVGLSKLSRLVEVYARRLQVQERLTAQIATALEQHLHPKGVGVVMRARHLCMESRGVCQQGHYTITSALRGVLREVPEARAEFMELARNNDPV